MPNTDKNIQQPWQTNQIESQRPNVEKVPTVLSGYIANSMNGGHNRTIAFKKVMAGERHREYKMHLRIRTLTPQTPAYQNIKMTIRSYWVPNSAVWKNAEKYTAQKGGSTEEKIIEIPNYGGKKFPLIYSENYKVASYQHTTSFRDHWMSSYIPRVGYNEVYEEQNQEQAEKPLPAASILPLRGRICIYNYLERNKEYDTELPMFDGDQVSTQEWNSYLGLDTNSITSRIDIREMRARRDTSYYTDIRSEAQGQETDLAESFGKPNEETSLLTWMDYENKANELRQEATNAQKTTWQIISELRGSKKLDEARPSLIGQKTFRLQYSSVTQNTYNTNTDVREEFTVMGQQGAYSYTEIEVPCYAGFEAKEEGYIHIIATVSSDDTVIESAFDRNELNITPFDEYRPDLANQKYDVMYYAENGNIEAYDDDIYYAVLGFKRKFSEYFRLPSVVAGDMTHLWYRETNLGTQNDVQLNGGRVITNSTYQLFEADRFKEPLQEGEGVKFYKKFWKDYTDVQINKNLAIPAAIDAESDVFNEDQQFRIMGNNQIDLVGRCVLVAELPIENGNEIKHNYTEWGEH